MENKRITRAVRNAARFMVDSSYGPELTKYITAGNYEEVRKLCHSINRKRGNEQLALDKIEHQVPTKIQRRVLTKANIDAMINSQDELWVAIDNYTKEK